MIEDKVAPNILLDFLSLASHTSLKTLSISQVEQGIVKRIKQNIERNLKFKFPVIDLLRIAKIIIYKNILNYKLIYIH